MQISGRAKALTSLLVELACNSLGYQPTFCGSLIAAISRTCVSSQLGMLDARYDLILINNLRWLHGPHDDGRARNKHDDAGAEQVNNGRPEYGDIHRRTKRRCILAISLSTSSTT